MPRKKEQKLSKTSLYLDSGQLQDLKGKIQGNGFKNVSSFLRYLISGIANDKITYLELSPQAVKQCNWIKNNSNDSAYLENIEEAIAKAALQIKKDMDSKFQNVFSDID